jgi:calcineurin-like phosphoesterase
VIRRFVTNMPQRFEVASGCVMLHGAVVEIDETTGKALGIRRVSETLA